MSSYELFSSSYYSSNILINWYIYVYIYIYILGDLKLDILKKSLNLSYTTNGQNVPPSVFLFSFDSMTLPVRIKLPAVSSEVIQSLKPRAKLCRCRCSRWLPPIPYIYISQ
ncbi:unnamed protein product [Citrullus colocynthis]|uniref:Uncharacterized protein n=1 Tax=Citrullus colocynthis TaxID=252529 RepID=A0ABP0YRR4_9ROSI